MTRRSLPGIGAALAIILGSWVTIAASDWPQWRGPQRSGVSAETGLLQQWPAEGPRLAWRITNVGRGFSTPAVVGDRLYLLSSEGDENELVRAFSVSDGALVWSTRIGRTGKPDQEPKFPTARSTPTIEDGTLFAFGSDGDLAALDTGTGRVRWQKNVRQEFGGESGAWAYAESPLVDGNVVVVTPGGRSPMMAFDKRTGTVVWTTPAADYGSAAYSSIAMAQVGGVKQYIAYLEKGGVFGVDARTGSVLWRDTRLVQGCMLGFQTPIVSGDHVYTACNGAGGALTRLGLVDGRMTATPVYLKPLPGDKGGSVVVDGLIYSTNTQALVSADFLTGDVKWRDRGVGVASITYADGRLYVRGESGQIALVEPSPEGYRERGRFMPAGQDEIPSFGAPPGADGAAPGGRGPGGPGGPPPGGAGGRGPDGGRGPGGPGGGARGAFSPPIGAWPHPVVANGRLYLRYLGTLWSYDIRR
ncbi:MAG: PQQ-binding-like beta-propeller repeat protein [Vicinamibacterales bacterium]